MSNPLRKTMVYLGLAEEEFDYDDAPVAAERQRAVQPAAVPAGGAVTPLRRSQPVHAPAAELSEILTVHPRKFSDAQGIAESFRDGVPVIMNLSQMSEADARRLVDFAGGLTMGLYGRIERVTSKVFLLSPEHVAVSGESAEPEPELDASFYPQS